VRTSATLRAFGDGLGVAVVVPVGGDRVLLAASGDGEEDDVVRLWDPVTGEQVGGATAHYDEDDDGHVVCLWDTAARTSRS